MLIQCPECKKEISDTTEKCIHCGYQLIDMTNKKHCKFCNRIIEIDDLQCGYCGRALITPQEAQKMDRDNLNKDLKDFFLPIIESIIGFLILVVILAHFF